VRARETANAQNNGEKEKKRREEKSQEYFPPSQFALVFCMPQVKEEQN
jgi:hypothetical protein